MGDHTRRDDPGLMIRRGLHPFALLAIFSACAGASVPRAQTDAKPSLAPQARPVGEEPWATRYAVRKESSRVDLYAADVITGDHRLTFERWTAHVVTKPAWRLEVTIETHSLRASPKVLEDFAKRRVLEVDRFPRATLQGTLRPLAFQRAEGTYEVVGHLELHGVTKPIRFEGSLTREGDRVRFRTQFVLARAPFDVRVPAPWEALVKNDVRIAIDAVAVPQPPTDSDAVLLEP